MIDLHQVKLALPFMLERLGCQPSVQGENLTALCPLHPDRKPSFTARFINGVWLWKCWPCELGGDAIDLFADTHGIPRKSKEAITRSAEFLGVSNLNKTYHFSRKGIPPKEPTQTKITSPLPENFDSIHRATRSRVYQSLELQELIAKELSVTPQTVKRLTFTSDALGWSRKHNRPLYLYESGIKIRNLQRSKIRFQWLMGRAEKPWRAHYLKRPNITRVFLTEGESDAIALIDAGLENLFPRSGETGTTIVASPGTSFKAEWAHLFKGKDLVLCTDNDDAGEKSAQRIAALCNPFTKTIRRYQWSVASQQ